MSVAGLKCSQIVYPKDQEGNLNYRIALIEGCDKDPGLKADVLAYCKEKILFWINNFCWTYDPRLIGNRNIPFVTYDAFQDDYIMDVESSILNQTDLFTDKSRDMGVSWMVLYNFDHKWLFYDSMSFRCLSRKEDYVDKERDMDTLFEKMRFTLQRLPVWMLPKEFNWKTDATYMKLVNKEKNNTIVGESANANAGRGGRSTAVLLDEFAFCENDEAIWKALGDTTNCRLPVSTPNGSGNKMAMLKADINIEKISLHWTLHPIKVKGCYYYDGKKKIKVDPERAYELWKNGSEVRSPWYDEQCERRTPAEVAEELDIDYRKSGAPFFHIPNINLQIPWEKITEIKELKYGKYICTDLKLLRNQTKLSLREDGIVRIFEKPESYNQYLIGADTAEGLEKRDRCAAVVVDKLSLHTVATINKELDPEEFAFQLYMLSILYNESIIAAENNNHGYTTNKELEKMGANIYYTNPNMRGAGSSIKLKRGFSTDRSNRRPMLDRLKDGINNLLFELRDPELIQQCYTFVRNKNTGKPEADGSFHDDLIIARSIADRVIEEFPYDIYEEDNDCLLDVEIDKMKNTKNAGMGVAVRRKTA